MSEKQGKEVMEKEGLSDWSEFNLASFPLSNNDEEKSKSKGLTRKELNDLLGDGIEIYCSNWNNWHADKNLGLWENYYWGEKGKLWAAGYVGAQWLRDKDNKYIKHNEQYLPLIVGPRFGDSKIIARMLETVLDDDEFHLYDEAREKTEQDEDNDNNRNNKKESNNTPQNKLFEVFETDPLIPLDSKQSEDFLFFQIVLFLRSLYDLCRKTIRYQPITIQENLLGRVKGKILINQHIRRNIVQGREDRVYCQYQKFSMDCRENRILKAAMEKSMRYLDSRGLTLERAVEWYHYCASILAPVALCEIGRQDFIGLKFNGVFKHYKSPIKHAERVLKGVSLILQDTESKSREAIPPYYINMNMLFEFYVRSLFRKAIKEKKLNAELHPYISFEQMKKDEKNPNKDELQTFKGKKPQKGLLSPFLIPDIWIRRDDDNKDNDNKNIVIDVKYKNTESNNYNARADTHQILAYGKKFDACVMGMVYPCSGNKCSETCSKNKCLEPFIINNKLKKDKLVIIRLPMNEDKKNWHYCTIKAAICENILR